MPPVLAGRETEKDILRKTLHQLINDSDAPNGILLSGPRGMGKTVLLEWFLGEAKGKVDVLDTSAQNIASIEHLALLVDPSLAHRARSSGTKLGANIAGTGVSIERSRGETMLHNWSEYIRARIMTDHPPGDSNLPPEDSNHARGRPLIVAVDEAHTLAPEVTVALLNIHQDAVKKKAPVFLILVGTPDLMDCLRNAGKHRTGALDGHNTTASFVERFKTLSPLALDDAATRQALLAPLKSGDCTVDEEPLQQLVAATQHYPYFIQLLGSAVWEEAQQHARLVDNAVVVQAQQAVAAEMNTLYRGRFNELNKEMRSLATRKQCLSAAYEVARYWLEQDQQPLTLGMMAECLDNSALPDAAQEQMEQRFKHTGFMVDATRADDGASAWTLGIPSLAQYIVDNTIPAMLPKPSSSMDMSN